jgi:hypothetical protein
MIKILCVIAAILSASVAALMAVVSASATAFADYGYALIDAVAAVFFAAASVRMFEKDAIHD